MRLKMMPTQFKDENTEDIDAYIKKPSFQLQKGDVIKLKGEWSGHREHVLIFLAASIQQTGTRINNF